MSQLKNIFYAQSGGVTAVINSSACGVIETARSERGRIGKVYAGRNGIIGALTEDLIDTSLETKKSIAALRHTPAGAFGACRYKLKSLDENPAEYERLLMSSGPTTSVISFTTAAAILPIPVSRYLSFQKPRVTRSRRFIFQKPLTMTCRLPTTAPALARLQSTSRSLPKRPASMLLRWRKHRPRSSLSRLWGVMPAGLRRPAAWLPATLIFRSSSCSQKLSSIEGVSWRPYNVR